MDLPFLLAGPIVRRVESRLVSVWVATSKPCGVRLSVWPGEVTAGTGPGVFDPGGEAAGGARETIRVGENLHIAVASAPTAGNQPLLPGTRYSYNVIFSPDVGDPVDLRSLGLLVDRPEQPAIGYQNGVLPSLATCPATIDELVMVHGSCNRIEAAGGPNLMFAIDELIKKSLNDPRHRPHQLWLTGDQVYADEVPAALSVGLTAFGRELMGADELLPLRVEDETLGIPLQQANFPAGYRQKLMEDEARLTSSEASSHLLGLTERLAMQLHLWSPEVWSRKPDGAVSLAAPAPSSAEPPLPQALEPVPPTLNPDQAGRARDFLAKHLTTFDDKNKLATAARKAEEEAERVLAYAAKVGVIRRALANVPTYLVFDDHDVTDDWFLCQLWKDRVLGSPLGRSIIRDGLVTFALTQGWGNNPAAFETGPGADLLAAAANLFPPTKPSGPDATAVADVDRLLGLSGGPATVRWNYTVDGAVHRVIACDTRTRRGFTGPVSPPVQLPDGEREVQIPEGPLPAGFEVLVVVLSQPALDPILLGELTQGLISHGAAAFAGIQDKMDLDKVRAKALTGLETLDYEGWGARPTEVALLLDRLSTYNRVLIMSGDVHFAVTLGLSFWRKGQGLVSTIGQFTSSAVQYITFPEALLPVLGQGWVNDLLGRGYPHELLVWRDPAGPPVDAPSLPIRGLRRRLMQRPVLLPARGWPTGTVATIPPDFVWRLQLIADTRPNDERPEPVQTEALVAEFDATDPLGSPNGYAALARRHAAAVDKHTNTRSLAIFNKVARLTFRHEGVRLVARSELFSVDHHGESAAAPEAFTVHELFYDEPVTTPEPTIGG